MHQESLCGKSYNLSYFLDTVSKCKSFFLKFWKKKGNFKNTNSFRMTRILFLVFLMSRYKYSSKCIEYYFQGSNELFTNLIDCISSFEIKFKEFYAEEMGNLIISNI
jgi:hypothetical protein